jgi:two-component system response regulator
MEANKKEILLVEDSRSDAELTILSLKNANVSNPVILIKDGNEALEYIFANGKFEHREKDNIPAFIILDLKLPKVDGIEVLRTIKSSEFTKNIPVIIFTSSVVEADVKECYRVGANSYIVKPFELCKFEKVVKELALYWISINHHN